MSDRFSDGLAQLMNNAMGLTEGLRREIETIAKSAMERMMAHMDLVSREEFEAVREMAITAREENAVLKARLDALTPKEKGTEA
jgi:BMFP domain-containing protein YqiC